MKQRPYQNLIVWKEAHALCINLYKMTSTYPNSEKFSLVNQMRRAAASVPTNIVEGYAKHSSKELARFLDIAHGSLEELHYQCVLSRDLQYIDQLAFNGIDSQIGKVGFLLTKFRTSIV